MSFFLVRVLLVVFCLRSGANCLAEFRCLFGGRMCLWGGSVPVSEVSLHEAWSLATHGE